MFQENNSKRKFEGDSMLAIIPLAHKSRFSTDKKSLVQTNSSKMCTETKF
jgi:hypothetical protein